MGAQIRTSVRRGIPTSRPAVQWDLEAFDFALVTLRLLEELGRRDIELSGTRWAGPAVRSGFAGAGHGAADDAADQVDAWKAGLAVRVYRQHADYNGSHREEWRELVRLSNGLLPAYSDEATVDAMMLEAVEQRRSRR